MDIASLVCGLDITNIVLYMSTDDQAKALRTIRINGNLELEKLSPVHRGEAFPFTNQQPVPTLKGLSHEIDFKNFDRNLQNLT